MSHIVTIKTEIRDHAVIREACSRLGLEAPSEGTFKLYDGSYTGIGIKLPGWCYPVVINTYSGEIKFDNYGGAWGKQAELDRFLQKYALEKTRIEARKRGYSLREETAKDGSIRVTLTQRS